ncbi:MAG: hypothetical protein HUJ61_08825, partial [Bacilli bacterium]|nr:hypothetical protein [Bacilli bacterium]
MKIKLNELEEQLARNFLEAKESNICAAEIYIEYLNEHYNDITDFDIKVGHKNDDISKSFYDSFVEHMEFDID